MADLANIKNDMLIEMMGDLSDVTYPFKASGERGSSNNAWNPDEPELPKVSYEGIGIFGLSFTEQDSSNFQIQQDDQKAIIFNLDGYTKPEIQDDIEYNGNTYKVIFLLLIPADNGWVLQLRKL